MSSKPELPVGLAVDDVRQAELLVQGFASFAITEADIAAFERANALARELRHDDLTVEQRSTKSDALFHALGRISDVLPPGHDQAFYPAFREYHDLMLVFPNDKTDFHTRQFHPNPDEATPGRANYIASALRASPTGPGIAVDAAQLPLLIEQAGKRGKLEPTLGSAILDANAAAEALNAPYYLLSDMLAQAMQGVADISRQKNLEGVEDAEAMAKWHHDMAAWDREVRPGQTQALDAALADIRRLSPGEATEAYLADFMGHYALQYRMNTEHPEQMEYLPAQDLKRQPGAFLPLDIARAGRDTGPVR